MTTTTLRFETRTRLIDTASILTDKVLLISGGTGSFGQKFAEIALTHSPKQIIIYSRGELLQKEMESRFSDSRLRFFIGDVRDKERLASVMRGVDIVVHAAALKQVPIGEYNPQEVIKTNVFGTMNIIEACIANSVNRTILISSDKAVQPINTYGATKMLAEKLFIQANLLGNTMFSCVRYGNVAFSRGSVIPLFLEQKHKSYITITDESMTRFWITLRQGVEFVISCLDTMLGGEILIPMLPSIRIVDLADAIAPDTKKVITGTRPGEKLHEVLISKDEARHTVELDDKFIIIPEINLKSGRFIDLPTKRASEYSSINNSHWLTKETLKEMIKCATAQSA